MILLLTSVLLVNDEIHPLNIQFKLMNATRTMKIMGENSLKIDLVLLFSVCSC